MNSKISSTESKNRAVLITGGAGYIGSHISLLFAQKGCKVILLDNLTYNQPFDFPWAVCVQGDVGDGQLVTDIIKQHQIEVIVHCAAHIDVAKSIHDPLNFYDNNVSRTIALLKTMAECSVNRFIFSSSCAVYGNPHSIPMSEDHPKNPISPYGRSKLMVEQILEDTRIAYGMEYVALRYFNAAGALPEFGLAERHDPEIHLIPLLMHAALYKKPFTLFGTHYKTPDGSCIRDFIHVWDIAVAHWLAFEHLGRNKESGCFNLGTGKGISVREMIAAVERGVGVPITTIIDQARAGDPAELVADATRAHSILGWQPTCSDLKTIVQSALAAEKLQKKLGHNSCHAPIF